MSQNKLEKDFFPTFEKMTECNLILHDEIGNFISNHQRKFITLFDNLKQKLPD
jgi:hypothetical protein